jgi:hypothetical protein
MEKPIMAKIKMIKIIMAKLNLAKLKMVKLIMSKSNWLIKLIWLN